MSERNQWSQPNQPSENESSGVIWPSAGAAVEPSSATNPYPSTTGSTQQTSAYNWDSVGNSTAQSSHSDPGQPYDGYGQGQTTSAAYQTQFTAGTYPGQDASSEQTQAAVGYPESAQATANSATRQGQSFLNDLLDLSFTRWATPTLAKIGYGIAMAVIALNVLFSLLMAFSTGWPLLIIGALFIVPLLGMLALSLIRVIFESAVAVIRIAENTTPVAEDQQ